MNALQRTRAQSFRDLKAEQSQLFLKKESQIKQYLSLIKNNSKIFNIIISSLNALLNLISTENSDYFMNIHSIIKLKGIKILCNLSSSNSLNEEIIYKSTLILKNLILHDNNKTLELTKFFLSKNGQNDVFQSLISIKNDKGINNLLEIIYKLIQVPQFFNLLLGDEMIDTIKFLNENNEKNDKNYNYLYKIIAKITMYNKGRELLLNDDFIKKIIFYIENNIKQNKKENIYDGLIILNNILKSDKNNNIIKELNLYKILDNAYLDFIDNEKILNLMSKILEKIVSEEEINDTIQKLKNCLNNGNIINEKMNELIDGINYLSNFIIVEDARKIISSEENTSLLLNLFTSILSFDLKNLNIKEFQNYISLLQYLMILFNRMVICGKKEDILKIKIQTINCVKNIFEIISILNINNEQEKEKIMNKFKSFFNEYCALFYKLITLPLMNNREILSILEYILTKIISNSNINELLSKDENFNYYFSLSLKAININDNDFKTLYNHLISCFPDFKNVINNINNLSTLSNIFDIIYDIIKTNKSGISKEDIILGISKFMKEKAEFRYPNLIGIKILNNLLNSEFIKEYISLRKKQNINNINNEIYNIDFIDCVGEVLLKEINGKIIKDNLDDDIEKEILIEGYNLIKRFISYEIYEDKMKELNELIKGYDSEGFNEKKLEKNITFHIYILNLNEYIIKYSNDILKNIKELISKEINHKEKPKKENIKDKDKEKRNTKNKIKNKETNIKNDDIIIKNSKIINLCIIILKKIENGMVINYEKTKDEKFINILKQIIEINKDIIENDLYDVNNKLNIIKQIIINISFYTEYKNNIIEEEQNIIEIYIFSLINLLRNYIYIEKLSHEIIKAFISFANYNTEIYNILIKSGCMKLFLKFLGITNNIELILDTILLIKKICFSNKENLIICANQNILITLFEIHTKFINEQKITKEINNIVNEVIKLPGQSAHIDEILNDTLKDFIENIKNDFKENEIKDKLWSDLIVINSYSNNPVQINKLINNKNFINVFFAIINKTLQENDYSSIIIEKLFTCEIELLQKIIYQHYSENNDNNINNIENNINVNSDNNENNILNQNFCEILLALLFHKNIFADNFILVCNILLFYINKEYLYSKFLIHKINKIFIEQFFELQENYVNNMQVSEILNEISNTLILKNQNFEKYVIKKFKLDKIINELKTEINCNDDNSFNIKYNRLSMIDALISYDNNMEYFVQNKGDELINNLIENEVRFINDKNKEKKLIDAYKSLCFINLKYDTNNDKNENNEDNFEHKSSDISMINDIIIEENKYKSSLINNNEKNNNNYIFYCLKIINKCLKKDKNQFLKINTINNLIKIVENYFPNKDIIFQLIEILLHCTKNEKFEIEEIDKNIIKLLISIKAHFYSQESIINQINDIMTKISEKLFQKNQEKYITDFKNILNEKSDIYITKYQILTYLSLIIDYPSFTDIFDKIKNEIILYFNDALLIIKNIITSQKNEIKNNLNFLIINKDEILISLIKIYNYFLNNKIINIKEEEIFENIILIEKVSNTSYIPNNYYFVFEYENQISKLIQSSKNFYNENHLKYVFEKLIIFIKNYSEEIISRDDIDIIPIKEKNLDNVLLLSKKYLKSSENKNITDELFLELYESLNNLLELLIEYTQKQNFINDKEKDISIRIKLIWKIILYLLQNDTKNILYKKILTNIKDILTKLNTSITSFKDINKPFLRKIPLILSEKNETNDVQNLYQAIYEFISEDMKLFSKNNEKIKLYGIKTLSNISKNYTIIKQFIKDKNLTQILKDEYSKDNIAYDLHLALSIIFKNCTKNNDNINFLLKSDAHFIQIIFSRTLKYTLPNIDNGYKQIAENEIETVLNIIKNKNNFCKIIDKNIVTNDEIKKIETAYDHLDINICKQFKHILQENEIDLKIKHTLESVKEDEENIKQLEKIIALCYERHALEYNKFFDRMKKEELLLNTIGKDDLLIDGKKRILGTKDIKKENKIKEKIKTPLSMIYNNKIYICITDILLILNKNYNLVSLYKDDKDNKKRIKLIHKSFNLLQLLSLAKDNHISILEEGYINLLEKMFDEYNTLIKNKKEENDEYIKYLFNLIVKAKNILKECSQYENSCELILDSSLFSDIITEMIEFQNNKFNSINSMNSVNDVNLRKIFLYDNSIIANIFSWNKYHEQILNKLDINLLLTLGLKTGNIVLLENIVDLIISFINKNGIELEEEINNKIFSLIEKYLKNKNSSSLLILKILNLMCLLYSIPDNHKKIEELKIIESINLDIKKFSYDSEYTYSALNCLCILIKNNLKFTEICFNIDLIKNIRIIINNYAKEMPDNYIQIIWKVTEFYYILIKNKPEMMKNMCELNVGLNVVNYLDIYNNKVMPKSEEEKKLENQQNQLDILNSNSDALISHNKKNISSKKNIKVNYVREIMMNCINFLHIVTSYPEGNNYLSENTSFNKYILLALGNDLNDNKFLIIALQCLSNYFKSDLGSNFLRANIVDVFQLIKYLQNKYYSNSGILINITIICGIIINETDNKVAKNYVKEFFYLIGESFKFQEWNLNLIKITLDIIKTSLEKNKYLIEYINNQFLSNIINIMKSYRDNYEIQLICYIIISLIIDEEHIHNFSDNSTIKELLYQIMQTIISIEKEDTKINNIIEQIKELIHKIIILLSNIEQYSENIISRIIIPFIKEMNDLSLDENIKYFIIDIFEKIFKIKENISKIYIASFCNNKGIETLIDILKTIDSNYTNSKLIVSIFNILKYILKSNEDYKSTMKNLKVSDIINNIIKYTSKLDKKIEFEGKSIQFLISNSKVKLEKIEEIDYSNIETKDPIGPIIKNFLISGRQVKIINSKGEIKEMQLSFTPDLLKVQAKSLKSNYELRTRNMIELYNMKSIIKGHGTNAFKKCGGLFRSMPKAENCFSIIGPRLEDGTTKALNVICNNESEVNKWIKYMEVVINYYKKNKRISNVITIKEKKV